MEFEQNVRFTIRILRENNGCTAKITSSKEFCSRGLEKYASTVRHEEKKLREKCHVLAVLKEQERQKRLGVRNLKVFRTLCKENSKYSVQLALEQAQRDAQEVATMNNKE